MAVWHIITANIFKKLLSLIFLMKFMLSVQQKCKKETLNIIKP